MSPTLMPSGPPDSNATPMFRLNGRELSLAGHDPSMSLLRWLNGNGLPGTKEGCADGDCGACTVALLEPDADGTPRWMAVNSCLMPIGQVAGRQVLSVEALAEGGQLHPVQQAMVDCSGSQCGYCTPGFVMSLFAGMHNGQLDDACIEGNLCRCTGYRPIRAAMASLRSQTLPAERPALQPAHPGAGLLSAQHGHHHSPDSLDEALALKQRLPGAVWICGATDLGVELSRERHTASAYIAVDRLPELRELQCGDALVRIGAAVSLSRLEAELHGVFPMLDQMLHWFAARQVRNRATLGGNLGSASPIGDLLPVLLALDARIELMGPQGRRWVAANEFFVDYRKTVRDEDEVIVAVEIPRRSDLHGASLKLAKRPSDDISTVAACFALAFDAQRHITHARLAYGGVAAVPLRAESVEQWLLGRVLDKDCVEQARLALSSVFTPLSDHRASAEYRRALCGNLFVKFAEQLADARVTA